MSNFVDLTGRRFGRLIVLGPAERKYHVICICDCGRTKIVRKNVLVYGTTKSCGCLAGRFGNGRQTHGMSYSPEFKAWDNMKGRCLNEKKDGYKNYGGRGIRICERWLNSFENFLADMGPRPGPSCSIDRKNNDGNYEPANCRWATRAEQNNNRRNVKNQN